MRKILIMPPATGLDVAPRIETKRGVKKLVLKTSIRENHGIEVANLRIHDGIKRKAHASKKIGRRFAIATAVVAIVTIVLVFGFFSNNAFFPPQNPKAAIVDQLGTRFANVAFLQTSTTILEKAGFAVDYYESREVTVEFYRNLPTHGYDLIVLRVHSTTHSPEVNYTGLFTSELRDKEKYNYEKVTDQILGGAFLPYHEGDPVYFVISSKFIGLSMKGGFANATIVMMGCDTLTCTDMAEAFVEKGAKVCIGWNASVSIGHTDQATTQLLGHLMLERQTISQATTKTNKDVGPDLEYNSTLCYYPIDAGNYVIPTAKSSSTLNAFTHVLEEEQGMLKLSEFHLKKRHYSNDDMTQVK